MFLQIRSQVLTTSSNSSQSGETCTKQLSIARTPSWLRMDPSSTILSFRVPRILRERSSLIPLSAKTLGLLCRNWCEKTITRRASSIAQKRYWCTHIRTASSTSVSTTLDSCFSILIRACRLASPKINMRGLFLNLFWKIPWSLNKIQICFSRIIKTQNWILLKVKSRGMVRSMLPLWSFKNVSINYIY